MIAYHPAVGTSFGMFSAGSPHVLPADQRGEEAYSAVYTGPVLQEPLEILGRPRLALWVDSDAEVITFAARLCDVAPDGSSALVTKGVLNATHRASHVEPTPLMPGEPTELDDRARRDGLALRAGSSPTTLGVQRRLPNTWPSPTLATSRLHRGADKPSRLILPVVGAEADPITGPVFEPSPFPIDPQAEETQPWLVTRDLMQGRTEVTIEGSSSSQPDAGYVRESKLRGNGER